jgi:cell division protease FtsH
MLLAGREAELFVFGNTTSGASDDLKRASELAIDMVSSLGLSKEFGLLSIKGVPDKLVGPHIQDRVLAEAKALLEGAQAACRQALEAQAHVLHAMTESLLRDETISGRALDELLEAGAPA